MPRGHHPLAETRPPEQVREFIADVRHVVRRCVDVMPPHANFLADTNAVNQRHP
jgi:tryptophan halogenase